MPACTAWIDRPSRLPSWRITRTIATPWSFTRLLLAALEIAVSLQPAHGEKAPNRRQIERRQSVAEDGCEGGGVAHARRGEPNGKPPFGDSDPARDGHEAAKQCDADIDHEQLREGNARSKSVCE